MGRAANRGQSDPAHQQAESQDACRAQSRDGGGNQASSMDGGYFNSSPQAVVDIKSCSSFSSNSAAFCDTYYDVEQSPDCVD